MRAVVVHGAGDLRVETVPGPAADADRVLVDIAYGGICGSDLHYVKTGANGVYRIREPLVLGHEVVGTVAHVGERVADAPPVGTPVALHPASPAPGPGDAEGRGLHLLAEGRYFGSAAAMPHTQGAFAERISVRPEQLRAIPEGLPLELAVLAEPLAVSLHGVDRARDRIAGARVLVAGSGPIGCLAIAALRARGAREIVASDIAAFPLGVAARVGADAVIDLTAEAVPAGSFDVVVECSGVLPSFVAAIDSVRAGGTIVQLGILPSGDLAAPLSKIISREITLHGSQRFENEIGEALEILAAYPGLRHVVTSVVPLEDAEAAFAEAADSSRSSKVVLRIGA